MAAKSSKTTFAKLDRERRLREKREAKRARRDARKANAATERPPDSDEPGDLHPPVPEESMPRPPIQS